MRASSLYDYYSEALDGKYKYQNRRASTKIDYS